MVPRNNKLSPLSRKMYNVLLYLSQMTLRDMQGVPPATHLFGAPLAEVLKICGSENQNQKAKKYLAEMRRSEVVWDSPDSDAELQQVGFNLLSESRILKKGGAIWVYWALPPTLYETLADPDRWASIDLLVLSRLQTYAAIVLYEICSKYRNNPTRVTCRKDPAWWVELLSSTPISKDDETGQRKLPEWRKFKNKFVVSAMEQINEYSDLTIELLEDRGGGKALKTIQFRVTVKQSARTIDLAPDGATVDPSVLQYASSLGVTGDKDIVSLTRDHGAGAVIDALRNLEERQKQLNLPLVRSPSGYLNHLIGQKTKVAQEVTEATPPLSAKVVLASANPPLDASAVQPASTSTAIFQMSAEQEAHQERREQLFREIMSLPEEDRRKWLDAYADSMRSKGLLTLAIARRLARADWYVGVVKSGVIDFYGTALHGIGWAQAAGSTMPA